MYLVCGGADYDLMKEKREEDIEGGGGKYSGMKPKIAFPFAHLRYDRTLDECKGQTGLDGRDFGGQRNKSQSALFTIHLKFPHCHYLEELVCY